MHHRSGLVCLAILVVASAPLAAQTAAAGGSFAIKKCDDPKAPIGILPKGFGDVSFLLGKDGRPDTTSITVTKTFGLSVAGVHSVAARELSACRFDMGSTKPPAPIRVVAEVQFADSSGVDVGVATATDTPPPALAIEPLGLPRDSFPMAIDDRRIEERPRQLECKPPQPPQIRVSASGSSRADAQMQLQTQMRIAAEQWNDVNAGTLVGQVRVGTDGKPGTQIRVISVSNSLAAQNLAEQIGGCRFSPGRYRGVAVPAIAETRIAIAPLNVR